MKESRHNGRAGKYGVYNPKHNDRRFDTRNSDHIDGERVKKNIYWDIYQEYRTGENQNGTLKSFDEIEAMFYRERYGDFCRAQNERNIENRHPERNRTTDDIRVSNKTCPEETIIQFGNISESISGELLLQITEEYYQRIDEMYGQYCHVIDWSLHMDEGTPHIHERHVFDCENKYGEIAPQQEKALEQMGIELPNPGKKEGRYNNRKMTFDKECRELLAQIASKYGINIDLTPTYGGREYMEKQDYIIAKQKEEIEEITTELNTKQQQLESVTMKLSDVDELVKEVTDEVYKQAVEVTKTKAGEIVGDVIIKNITMIDEKISSSRNYNQGYKMFASKILGQLKDAVKRSLGQFGEKIKDTLLESSTMKESKAVIEEKAGISIRERLARGKQESKQQAIGMNRTKKERDI